MDAVQDSLWGESAEIVILAEARGDDDTRSVSFMHVGGASSEETIALPGAALRASVIQLRGSRAKSVPLPKLLAASEQDLR